MSRSFVNRIQNIPVKLIEKSSGRVVELEISEPRNLLAELYMDQLKTYAELIMAEYTVSGKRIKMTFKDGDMAESVRQMWKKL